MQSDADDEQMITQHIPSVLKQAINTFRGNPETFRPKLDQLACLFNKTTSTHVNLHPMFMRNSTWNLETKAPMTYINIYNNDIINVGIFVLKPNMKLPLHNHPQMYGLLKVIAGTVKVRSYSVRTEKTKKYDEIENLDKLTIIAEKNEDILADEDSQCCILDPNYGNIHEIETVDSPAAFIDILSPPYDTEAQDIGLRKCSYFRIIKEREPNIFELQEIRTPSWFWSDTYPYTGPDLVNED